MRKRWTTVVLQRTKQRIGIDLIARAIQITAAVIAAEIVSLRGDGAAAVEDVCTQCAGIQDCIGDLNDALVINAPPEPAELPVIVLFAMCSDVITTKRTRLISSFIRTFGSAKDL